MIFANVEFKLGLNVTITSDLRDQTHPNEAGLVRMRWRHADESRESNRALGIKPVGEEISIPETAERYRGIIVESVPVIGAPDTPGLQMSHQQLTYLPSTHNDPRPAIFLLGLVTPTRARFAVLNYNRFAVERRIEISDSADFTNKIGFDLNLDWYGMRIPTPIPQEFVLTKGASTATTLYIRVAHSAVLQNSGSAEPPGVGWPLGIYNFPPEYSAYSDVIAFAWPAVDTPFGGSGIFDSLMVQSGSTGSLAALTGLNVSHPSNSQWVDGSIGAGGGGGGSTAWSAITAPIGNLLLNHSQHKTQFSWSLPDVATPNCAAWVSDVGLSPATASASSVNAHRFIVRDLVGARVIANDLTAVQIDAQLIAGSVVSLNMSALDVIGTINGAGATAAAFFGARFLPRLMEGNPSEFTGVRIAPQVHAIAAWPGTMRALHVDCASVLGAGAVEGVSISMAGAVATGTKKALITTGGDVQFDLPAGNVAGAVLVRSATGPFYYAAPSGDNSVLQGNAAGGVTFAPLRITQTASPLNDELTKVWQMSPDGGAVFGWTGANLGPLSLWEIYSLNDTGGGGTLLHVSTRGAADTRRPLEVLARNQNAITVWKEGTVVIGPTGVPPPLVSIHMHSGTRGIRADVTNDDTDQPGDLLYRGNAAANYTWQRTGDPSTGTWVLGWDNTNKKPYWTTGGVAAATKWNTIANPDGNQTLDHGIWDTLWDFSGANIGHHCVVMRTATDALGTDAILAIQTRGAATTKSPLRVFVHDSTYAFHIDPAGRVGINVTTPATTLHVSGSVQFDLVGGGGGCTGILGRTSTPGPLAYFTSSVPNSVIQGDASGNLTFAPLTLTQTADPVDDITTRQWQMSPYGGLLFKWTAPSSTVLNLFQMYSNGEVDGSGGTLLSVETRGTSDSRVPFQVLARNQHALSVRGDGTVLIGPASLPAPVAQIYLHPGTRGIRVDVTNDASDQPGDLLYRGNLAQNYTLQRTTDPGAGSWSLAWDNTNKKPYWTAAGSGGGSAWSALTAPTADLVLDHANYKTRFVWDSGVLEGFIGTVGSNDYRRFGAASSTSSVAASAHKPTWNIQSHVRPNGVGTGYNYLFRTARHGTMTAGDGDLATLGGVCSYIESDTTGFHEIIAVNAFMVMQAGSVGSGFGIYAQSATSSSSSSATGIEINVQNNCNIEAPYIGTATSFGGTNGLIIAAFKSGYPTDTLSNYCTTAIWISAGQPYGAGPGGGSTFGTNFRSGIAFTGPAFAEYGIDYAPMGVSGPPAIRLGNNQWIVGRNAAENADVKLWRVNTSNLLETQTNVTIVQTNVGGQILFNRLGTDLTTVTQPVGIVYFQGMRPSGVPTTLGYMRGYWHGTLGSTVEIGSSDNARIGTTELGTTYSATMIAGSNYVQVQGTGIAFSGGTNGGLWYQNAGILASLPPTTNGFVLTLAAGLPTWAAAAAGGGGTPGGPVDTLQYNSAGSFGAVSGSSVTVGGVVTLQPGLFLVGDGVNPFLNMTAWGNATCAFSFIRGRGTKAAPTRIKSGDVIASIAYYGQYGQNDTESVVNNYVLGGSIVGQAVGDFVSDGTGPISHPMDLLFKTDNTAHVTGMILTSDSRVVIGAGVVHADAVSRFTVVGTTSLQGDITSSGQLFIQRSTGSTTPSGSVFILHGQANASYADPTSWYYALGVDNEIDSAAAGGRRTAIYALYDVATLPATGHTGAAIVAQIHVASGGTLGSAHPLHGLYVDDPSGGFTSLNTYYGVRVVAPTGTITNKYGVVSESTTAFSGVGGTPTAVWHVTGSTRFDLVSSSGNTDAAGDMYWRTNTGVLKNLPLGVFGSILKAAGGLGPIWTSLNASDLSGVVSIAQGGTGLSTVPGNMQMLIGNGTAYTLSTLTQGANVTITNSGGVLTIAAAGGGSGMVVPGSGTELQYRSSATALAYVSGSSVSGSFISINTTGAGLGIFGLNSYVDIEPSTNSTGYRSALFVSQTQSNSSFANSTGWYAAASVNQIINTTAGTGQRCGLYVFLTMSQLPSSGTTKHSSLAIGMDLTGSSLSSSHPIHSLYIEPITSSLSPINTYYGIRVIDSPVTITNKYGIVSESTNSLSGVGGTPSAVWHVIGSTRFDVGGDQQGDLHYRASTGLLARTGDPGGAATYYLAWDNTNKKPYWTTVAGGSATPATPTSSIQYNNAGSFGGMTGTLVSGTGGIDLKIGSTGGKLQVGEPASSFTSTIQVDRTLAGSAALTVGDYAQIIWYHHQHTGTSTSGRKVLALGWDQSTGTGSTGTTNAMLELYVQTNAALSISGTTMTGIIIDPSNIQSALGTWVGISMKNVGGSPTTRRAIYHENGAGDVVLNAGANLAAGATQGHFFIPVCATAPTGNMTGLVPTGSIPLVFCSADKRLYMNIGAATWIKSAALS